MQYRPTIHQRKDKVRRLARWEQARTFFPIVTLGLAIASCTNAFFASLTLIFRPPTSFILSATIASRAPLSPIPTKPNRGIHRNTDR